MKKPLHRDIDKKLTTLREIEHLIRIVPITLVIVLTVHCLLLLNNIDNAFLRSFSVTGAAISVLLARQSSFFSFCWAHKACIVYIVMMTFCIELQRDDWFSRMGFDVDVARKVMLCIGIIIISCVLYRFKKHTYCNGKRK